MGSPSCRPQRGHRDLVAGCGRNSRFEAGAHVPRRRARDEFYAIGRGAVALEMHVPRRGPLIVETLARRRRARLVLALPSRTGRSSTRARSSRSRAIAFDGACLRGKCEADHELGYELMRRFAAVITKRLQATRLRLLDVYGTSDAGR